MFKRIALLAVLTALVVGTLTACGGNTQSSSSGAANAGSAAAVVSPAASSPQASNTASVSDSNHQDLVVKESGYAVSSSGYIHWGAIIENPNSDLGASFPKINIVGKSEDGKILFSDDQTLKDIYPGETIAFGGQAGNKDSAPATVEFSVSVDDKKWKKMTDSRSDLYTIENLSDVTGTSKMGHFTGEITLNSDTSIQGAQKPAITLILRDSAGSIVYGTTTFQKSELTPGTAAAFEVSASGIPDDYSMMEIYATPWN